MTGRRRSFYLDTWGPDADAIREAFRWLAEAGARSSSAQGLLVVPLKQQLRRDNVLTKVLGTGRVGTLDNGGRIKLDGGSFSAATTKTLPYHFEGPVLAVWLNDKYMDKIDAIYGVTEVLAVPFVKNSIRRWVDTWEAEEITGKARGTRSVPDPVVQVALKWLADFVNKGGLGLDDEYMAVETFTILRDGRIPFTADEVRSWLMAEHNFPPDTANTIAKKAEGILARRRLRRSRHAMLRADALDQWRKEAGV